MKRKDKRNQRVRQKVDEVISAYRDVGTDTDPMGMYTGITEETRQIAQNGISGGKIYMPLGSVPTQDADDL